MIKFFHRLGFQETQGRSNLPLKSTNPAWDPDRPLPTPSNDWVDRKVEPVPFTQR